MPLADEIASLESQAAILRDLKVVRDAIYEAKNAKIDPAMARIRNALGALDKAALMAALPALTDRGIDEAVAALAECEAYRVDLEATAASGVLDISPVAKL